MDIGQKITDYLNERGRQADQLPRTDDMGGVYFLALFIADTLDGVEKILEKEGYSLGH